MPLSRRELLIAAMMLAASQTACAIKLPFFNDITLNGVNAEGITVVPSDASNIKPDTVWCVSFQLVWDELRKMLFSDEQSNPLPNNQLSVELCDAQFHGEGLEHDDVYYFSGHPTISARDTINKELQQRFNQTSDILGDITFYDDPEAAKAFWMLYCMLYVRFKFSEPFTVHEHESFGSLANGNQVNDITYFGYFENESDDDIEDQIRPAFWKSDDCFGIWLKSTSDDKCFVVRGGEGKTFAEVWRNAQEWEFAQSNEIIVTNFKMPRVSMFKKVHFEELFGVIRPTKSNDFVDAGEPVEITDTIQTIKFELDEFGGVIKSEAYIGLMSGDAGSILEPEKHDFIFDDDFYIFVTRPSSDGSSKHVPYLAAYIHDISKFSK